MLQQWKPDPTFYPSPKMAIEAPIEDVAYVAAPRDDDKPDAMCVVDLNSASDTYGEIVNKLELGVRDEIHHFGWNACSAAPLSIRTAPLYRTALPRCAGTTGF